ncbi:P-loop containing nucleoside triphosphate hydrolase [Artemisia annua]|uniref:P-loop containing nucleoside triphosphate hydrolase n=1 Tax=Artemisia annua TaxID=35608 RepID=A0A2U1L1G9_ARTAN|nr:P-loop containing nucleoside triphosphate hydrolase [Artemisia annua]
MGKEPEDHPQFLHGCIPCNVCAPLYLFHGPYGTGKTSTVRVFAMALNCESNNKPCCTCKGCSRSLYTMDLCSGNRISGFEKIKTLLQNTSFAQRIPGLVGPSSFVSQLVNLGVTKPSLSGPSSFASYFSRQERSSVLDFLF